MSLSQQWMPESIRCPSLYAQRQFTADLLAGVTVELVTDDYIREGQAHILPDKEVPRMLPSCEFTVLFFSEPRHRHSRP